MTDISKEALLQAACTIAAGKIAAQGAIVARHPEVTHKLANNDVLIRDAMFEVVAAIALLDIDINPAIKARWGKI